MSIELDVKLVKYVEKFPFLYYKGAMNYNNELLLANTWKKIGRDLKVSPEYCMNRWKYLRRRFTKEPKFALPEKEWILMKYLRFLEPFIHRRKPLDRLTEAPPIPEFEWSECDSQSVGSRDEWENESRSSASESKTLPSWKQSNDSFCQSLSNTLQTLTTDQQVSCRIDMLVVIEKYLSSINVGNDSNSTNSTASISHSRLDTLASDMSKRFAEILNKINCGSISSFDDDWLIIFAAKNFVCKLLEMRKVNAELDKMLPALVSVNTVPQIAQEHGRQIISAPRTTAELKKPVCMNRKSEMSKIDGNNKSQPSSIFNPQLANSAEIRTDALKTVGAAGCTQFYSSERVSQNAQHLLESNQDFVKRSTTWKPIHQSGVHHNPVQSCLSLNRELASFTHVETRPIKTESSETLLGSSEPLSQNLLSVSNSKNSNHISLKPSLAKQIPKSVPSASSNNVIRIRPTTNVKVISNSTVDLRTSNSTVNLGLSNYATNSHVSNFPASRSIPEKRSTEFENAVHKTLKNINSENSDHGFMQDGNRLLCVLCDIWFPSELFKSAHTRDSNHENYTRDYFLHCSRVKKTALPKLDKSLYVVLSSGLFCVKCEALMKCRNSFVAHMACGRHKNQFENLPVEATMIGSIDQVIVSIGLSDYCVLCNVKLFDIAPSEHISSARHLREIALLKGIFKIDRHAYCSYCIEKFPLAALTLHVNNGKHSSKIF